MISYIDQKYISALSCRLEGFRKVGDGANFKCPKCGDSASNKHKKRGWLLTNRGYVVFFCHNCSASLSFSDFLSFIDPNLHKEYVYDILKEKYGEREVKTEIPKPSREFKKDPDYIKDFLSVCKPISKLPKDHPAVIYCEERQIPSDKISKLFYVDNIRDISVLDKTKKYEGKIVDNDPRIILPIWGPNYLVGVTCRSLEAKPKKRYLIYKFVEDIPLIFNLYTIDGELGIDIKKPVFVTEGGFDSLFLDNAIAVNGADLKRVMKILSSLNLIFIPDKEPRNKQILHVYKEIIKMGQKLVIIPEYMKGKDINQMVLSHGIDKVKSIINSNIVSGLEAELKLSNWKKC